MEGLQQSGPYSWATLPCPVCFETVWRAELKVNLGKLELISVAVILASILGCKLGAFLAKYLGLPLASSKAKTLWDGD